MHHAASNVIANAVDESADEFYFTKMEAYLALLFIEKKIHFG